MEEKIILGLVCTDRGQHPFVILGDIQLSDGRLWKPATSGPHAPAVVLDQNPKGDFVADAKRGPTLWIEDVDSRQRVQIRCPRCPRNDQWRGERAIEIMTRAVAAGLSRLDVSHAR